MNKTCMCRKIVGKIFKKKLSTNTKRLGGFFCKVEIAEFRKKKFQSNPAESEIENILKRGLRILDKISDGEFVITLEILGKMMDSEEFSGFFTKENDRRNFEIYFCNRRKLRASLLCKRKS